MVGETPPDPSSWSYQLLLLGWQVLWLLPLLALVWVVFSDAGSIVPALVGGLVLVWGTYWYIRPGLFTWERRLYLAFAGAVSVAVVLVAVNHPASNSAVGVAGLIAAAAVLAAGLGWLAVQRGHLALRGWPTSAVLLALAPVGSVAYLMVIPAMGLYAPARALREDPSANEAPASGSDTPGTDGGAAGAGSGPRADGVAAVSERDSEAAAGADPTTERVTGSAESAGRRSAAHPGSPAASGRDTGSGVAQPAYVAAVADMLVERSRSVGSVSELTAELNELRDLLVESEIEGQVYEELLGELEALIELAEDEHFPETAGDHVLGRLEVLSHRVKRLVQRRY